MTRPVRTAFLAGLRLGPRGRSPARPTRPPPRPRPRALLRQPGDRRRPALARRPVHRLPEALEGHPQRLGQEDGRALRHGPPRDGRDEAADPRLLLEPRQQATSSSSRTRTATRTSTSGPSTPAASAGGRQGRPALAQPHRRQGRARVHLRGARRTTPDTIYVGLNDRDAAWHDVYKVTISTGKRELVRKNTEQHRRLGLRPRGPAPAGGAHRRQRRHRDPEGRARGLQEGLHVHRLRDLRPDPLPQGRQARLHADEQGRRRTSPRLVLFDPETGKEELVESDPMNRVDFGSAIFSEADRRARRDHLRGRADARLLPRQGAGRPTTSCSRASSRARTSPSARPPPTTGVVLVTACERHRPRRALPVRPQRPRSSPCSTRSASASRASTWRR